MADSFTGTPNTDVFTAETDASWTISGLGGDDFLFGRAGNDTITGDDGDDRMSGAGGADTLDGGAGNDRLTGGFNTGFGPQPGDGADILRGGAGFDQLRGGDGDDQLFGGADDDNLRGDAGSDLLDGGDGTDFASYFLIAATASVVLDFSEFRSGQEFTLIDPLGGTDTLRGIEMIGIGGSNFNDVLTGSFTADSLDKTLPRVFRGYGNRVSGLAGNDVITGGGGDDRLEGGTGNDRIIGLGGFDTAVLDFGSTNEISSQPLVTAGVVFSGAALVSASATTRINAGVLGTDTLTGVESLFIYGSRYADTLTGSGLQDSLQGSAGNDSLDGGVGSDVAIYTGDRLSYDIVRLGDGSVRVTDTFTFVERDGVDTLTRIETLAFQGDGTTVAINRDTIGTLGDDIMAGGETDDTFYAGDGNDVLRGGAGNDALVGGSGNDTFDEATEAAGDDAINGGAGNDVIFDFSGNNALLGGDGDDLMGGTGTLFGGGGNDTFVELSTGSTADTLHGELGADMFILGAPATGFAADRIADFDIPGGDRIGVYNLIDRMIGWTGGFAGAMFAQGYLRFVQRGTDAVLQFDRDGAAGTSFGFVDQVILSNQGSTAISTLQGRVGLLASSMGGTAGNDTITGGEGNDAALRGYGGDDVINGLGGNDFIEGGNGRDQLNGGDGDDIILGDLFGVLSGGSDRINGGNGNDRIAGLAGNDTIDGGNGDDELSGEAGADKLDGGAGNDTATFSGRQADYTIERISESTIRVTDLRLGRFAEGIDLLTSIETLSFFDGDVASVRFGLQIDGTVGADRLRGSDGNDRLRGLAGNDRLEGLGGDDIMNGGAGDDTYLVDSAGDRTIELAGNGTDTVFASISHLLAADVENLRLTGAADISGTGNALANVLTGNQGANSLSGRGGNDILVGNGGQDVLTGGGGADVFRFMTSSLENETDQITDFVRGTDKIELSRAGFAALAGEAAGQLAANRFVVGAAATTADHRLIYDQGTLLYDRDGTGSAAQEFVAFVGDGILISATDIVLI